jgi:UDP-glucose 4-epimerase
VRDYIHVVDLAVGHIKALKKINGAGFKVYNLGTGAGVSVFEMIAAFEAASGVKIPFETVARRAGDIAECYADPSLARRELGFEAKKSLAEMCADSWHWQSKNPKGYE